MRELPERVVEVLQALGEELVDGGEQLPSAPGSTPPFAEDLLSSRSCSLRSCSLLNDAHA